MVEIKVTGNMPLEALANLTALGMHCMKNSEVHAAAIRILETEKNTEKKKTALAVETLPADPPGPAAGETGPTAAPSEEAAPPAPAPIPEESPAPKSATSKAPSLEDIRAKGIEAAKKHGQPAIKAILKELGAENMTNLPEDKRVLFLEKLEGLGEGNG
ncbi:MAG: hypothetical protein HFG00_11865 [Oscillibacter sp.]|jgi:hypothetical protein|nr:hypothetical protein [Oscillibacter sp.]